MLEPEFQLPVTHLDFEANSFKSGRVQVKTHLLCRWPRGSQVSFIYYLLPEQIMQERETSWTGRLIMGFRV